MRKFRNEVKNTEPEEGMLGGKIIKYPAGTELAISDYLNGEPIDYMKIFLEETDEHQTVSFTDHKEPVDSKVYDFYQPLRLESPEDDRSAEISFTSEPTGATVYLAGRRLGKTPLSVTLLVDYQHLGA